MFSMSSGEIGEDIPTGRTWREESWDVESTLWLCSKLRSSWEMEVEIQSMKLGVRVWVCKLGIQRSGQANALFLVVWRQLFQSSMDFWCLETVSIPTVNTFLSVYVNLYWSLNTRAENRFSTSLELEKKKCKYPVGIHMNINFITS